MLKLFPKVVHPTLEPVQTSPPRLGPKQATTLQSKGS